MKDYHAYKAYKAEKRKEQRAARDAKKEEMRERRRQLREQLFEDLKRKADRVFAGKPMYEEEDNSEK